MSSEPAGGEILTPVPLPVATEGDALATDSAIAYRSRGGNRLVQSFSGDISLALVTGADRPVIAPPREDTA